MAETLATLDGEAVDVDQAEAAFAAAMAAPPADRPGMAAPPRKPPEPAPDPEKAPHGWTWTDGEWRPKKAAGRPRRGSEDKARVTDAPPAMAAPAGPGVKPDRPKVDYRKTVKEFCEGVWFLLAAAPLPDKVFGYEIGAVRTRVRVQAYLVEQNANALAAGFHEIGQHNRFVARGLARLKAGEAGLWILPTMMLLAPFATATSQLWGGQLDAASLDAIAAKTEADVADYLEKLTDAAVQDATAMAEAAEV